MLSIDNYHSFIKFNLLFNIFHIILEFTEKP